MENENIMIMLETLCLAIAHKRSLLTNCRSLGNVDSCILHSWWTVAFLIHETFAYVPCQGGGCVLDSLRLTDAGVRICIRHEMYSDFCTLLNLIRSKNDKHLDISIREEYR